MAQKNVSVKTARLSTEKKSICEKEDVKLPALSPTKKIKDAPMPVKPAAVPGAKVAKALPPKSPSKPTARSVPTKLPVPVKAQATQSTTHKSAAEGEVAEGTGPELSSTLAVEGSSTPPTSENVLLDGVAMADAPPNSVEASIADPSPEDVAAEAAAAAEEVKRLRQLNGNGMVKLVYEQYDEQFPIEDGSTTQANIDEVYCLSFVMPNCLVRLSQHPNLERFQREENGVFDSLVHEDPRGTYHDLEKDRTYYVVVEQEADQLRRDQEATKALWDGELQKQKKADKDDGRGFETCSCIYGNPCVDEYGCRDWHSRFAVATKNGWKGF